MKPFIGVIENIEKYPFLEISPDGKSKTRSEGMRFEVVCYFTAVMTHEEMRAAIGKRVKISEA